MPIITYSVATTLLILAVPSVAVVLSQLVGGGNSPDMRDAWSVLGAMLATVIVALTEGKPGTRSAWRVRSIAMIVSSAYIGSVGPGFAMYEFFPFLGYIDTREAAKEFTWHGWSMLGFGFGLCGWGIVRGFLLFADFLPTKVRDWICKVFGIPYDNDNDNDDNYP